jgi:hypothetical protein
VTVPPRFSKSGSHAQTYKRATALECLVSAMELLARRMCAVQSDCQLAILCL